MMAFIKKFKFSLDLVSEMYAFSHVSVNFRLR